MLRFSTALTFGLGVFLLGAPRVSAQPRAGGRLEVPGAGSVRRLAIGTDAAGRIWAKTCLAAGACQPGSADTEIPVPAELRRPGAVTLTSIPVGSGRSVGHLRGKLAKGEWQAIVHAPLAGAQPVVAFAGKTGLVKGQDGDRQGPSVVLGDPAASGVRRVVLGELHENLDLCGRGALLAPQLFYAKQMKFRRAKLQRLSRSEQASAPRLTATRVPEADAAAAAGAPEGEEAPAKPVEGAAKTPRVLRATGASSAVGDPAHVTDGKLSTTWAENRGGAGRGEFVMMLSAPEIPISSFELVLRPTGAEPSKGAAPKELWLATREQLFHVTLPDDAWETPGARYQVELPNPTRSDCVALVSESTLKSGKGTRVTVAELSARTQLDGAAIAGLVGALAGGGERAESAGALLRQLGDPAFAELASRYHELDEGGRRIALDVIDHAPCERSASVYVAALQGEHRGQRVHGRDRLRRCGPQAAPLLRKALKSAKGVALARLAQEVSWVAPIVALEVLTPRLAREKARVRGPLRIAIARAARDRRSRPVVERLLSKRLPAKAQIDLLRALGPQLSGYRSHAEAAFKELATREQSFRSRYLLLEPAAQLSGKGTLGRDFIARMITSDQSPHVRARAAALASANPGRFKRALLGAAKDKAVRVREAALESLAGPGGNYAQGVLVQRLEDDRWPMVRAAAAVSLTGQKANPRADAALARVAEEDGSVLVRRPALLSLGARGARRHAPVVQGRLDDRDEDTQVRAAAAVALGLMCHRESADLLTGYAVKLARPAVTRSERDIGQAALVALGRLAPADLKERLSDFESKDTPTPSRAAAQAALRSKGECR